METSSDKADSWKGYNLRPKKETDHPESLSGQFKASEKKNSHNRKRKSTDTAGPSVTKAKRNRSRKTTDSWVGNLKLVREGVKAEGEKDYLPPSDYQEIPRDWENIDAKIGGLKKENSFLSRILGWTNFFEK